MRLTEIRIDNVLGVRHARIKPTKPVTLIAGDNGAGKSSMAESIRQALGLAPVRVDLKKEFAALLHANAPHGTVYVEFGEESAAMTLPAGELAISPGLDHPALLYVVEPERFASESERLRRTFLLSLMGIKTTPKSIISKLLARGLPAAECEEIGPMLAAGCDAAADTAQSKAREAKGAWRAITNETYGSLKAQGWAAPVVNIDQTAITSAEAQLATLDGQIETTIEAIGRLQGAAAVAEQRVTELASVKETAGKLNRARIKLTHDQAEAARLRDIVAEARQHQHGERYACPCCEAVLILLNGKLTAFEREAGDDTAMEAAADLSRWEAALATCEAAVNNDQRDIAAAEAATERLAILEAAPALINSQAQLVNLKAELDMLKDQRRTALSELESWQAQRQALTLAATATTDAARHHAAVHTWTQIADALQPEGIPAELLADALTPLNELLADLCDNAGWAVVWLNDNAAVHVSHREYRQLSESEKWRADAILAAAFALVSGLKFILLDRFDVLDSMGRSDALYWLDGLAAESDISALVLGTLKAVPSGLPEQIAGYWISGGEIKEESSHAQ